MGLDLQEVRTTAELGNAVCAWIEGLAEIWPALLARLVRELVLAKGAQFPTKPQPDAGG